jgi:hypothetical protein
MKKYSLPLVLCLIVFAVPSLAWGDNYGRRDCWVPDSTRPIVDDLSHDAGKLHVTYYGCRPWHGRSVLEADLRVFKARAKDLKRIVHGKYVDFRAYESTLNQLRALASRIERSDHRNYCEVRVTGPWNNCRGMLYQLERAPGLVCYSPGHVERDRIHR